MVSVNSMWCSILIHLKLTELFGIEIFSAAKGTGKVLLIIIIYYSIIIIIMKVSSQLELTNRIFNYIRYTFYLKTFREIEN